MSALTAEQAQSLALAVRDYARTASDFLHDQWDNLADENRRQVHDTIFDLLLRADDVNALAGSLVLDSAQGSVEQINATVASAGQFLRKVSDVKKAIGVIATGLDLATAIASKNPAGILNGVKALKQALT